MYDCISFTVELAVMCVLHRQLGKALYMDKDLAVPFVLSSASDPALPSKVQSASTHQGTSAAAFCTS